MGTSICKIVVIYDLKNELFYPYEYFKDKKSYYKILGSIKSETLGNIKVVNIKEDLKSSLTSELPSQEEVDNFNRTNSKKTGKEVTLENMHNDIYILQHCFSSYTGLNIKTY